jgi:putative salt-induced outer membrane protein YdiY
MRMTSRALGLSALIIGLSGAASGQAPRANAKTSFTGDFGFVDASGNTRLSTLNVGDKVVRTDGRLALSQLGAYVYGKTKGVESANQLRIAGRSDFAFLPRLATFAGVSFDRNPFAGFKRRTDEIAGLTWKAIVAPSDSLSLDGGGALTQESDLDGTSKSYPAARAAGAYKHNFTKSSYFTQLGEYIPNLKTSGAYRANSESAIVAPLSAHIGIKTAYIVRYDSKPPVTFGTTDRVLTTGIQISY